VESFVLGFYITFLDATYGNQTKEYLCYIMWRSGYVLLATYIHTMYMMYIYDTSTLSIVMSSMGTSYHLRML
jgi:hypothetical protein